VDVQNEAAVGVSADVSFSRVGFDLESIFHAHYVRIARAIAGIIKDSARAEELAVEVFLKWERTPAAQREGSEGWLYRTAVRMALNDLRRTTRRNKYENLFAFMTFAGHRESPVEESFAAQEKEQKVRLVLSVIQPRQAELLLLRGNGLTYEELASALDLNPASIGTLLSRALAAFRKEFIQRYGTERYE
jgi:RNA polymerase sigma-70 factor (ECF subfamily)